MVNMKLPESSEKQIQNAIIELLNYEKYFVWRNNTGAQKFQNADGPTRWIRFGQPGFSDIFAIQPKTGRFVALEVKTPRTRNSATRFQLDFIQRVQEQGGIAAIVTSTEDVVTLLGLRRLL